MDDAETTLSGGAFQMLVDDESQQPIVELESKIVGSNRWECVPT